MSSEFRRLSRALAIALLAVLGCSTEESALSPGLTPPGTVRATAISMSGIRIDWTPQAAGVLDKYRIERREDLSGRFKLLAEVAPNATSYFNTGLDADRFYGYRIIAISREGERSEPSIVAGAHTAPLPGLQIGTGTEGGTDASVADPNGYRVTLTGPRDTSVSVGTFDLLTITPLPAGVYTVTLSDVLPTCTITGDTVRTVTVVDTGLVTRAGAQFTATCSDPSRGRLVAEVAVTGDSIDADGFLVNYAGIIPGDTLPVLGGAFLGGEGGSTVINALRPGEYDISLGDVELPCRVTSSPPGTVQVRALAVDTVRFEVTCPDRGGGNQSAPLVYRNEWSKATAATGETVTLDVTLDLSAMPGQSLGVIQAELRYDPALLTYTGAAAPPGGQLGTPVVNAGSPGSITWLGVGATGPTGVIPAARFSFTVLGSAGTAARSRTTIELTADASGAEALDTLFRIVEDTLAIGGGGGGSNQPPVARANGPYNGTAGVAITFSSAGSSDADGTIASYGWTFSDGTTSTQPNPGKTFAAAGSYTATLTVTDDDGATATSQAAVTVTAGGGGSNQAPVARVNGPFSVAAGAEITLSSAGSTDPDGSIVSYAWSFGDNTSSTQANPRKSYAAAGSYTITLTVTDNLGATGSAQTVATVAAGSTGPVWTSTFGAFDQAFQAYPLVVTLNLIQDLSQTPGPEAVQSYIVDSLVWDPAVFQYHSLAFGSGGGSFNTTDAVGGCKCKISFSGSPSANSGLVTIARVLLKPIGSAGASMTTKSAIGAVLSTPANGSFNYRSVMQVVEGTITLP